MSPGAVCKARFLSHPSRKLLILFKPLQFPILTYSYNTVSPEFVLQPYPIYQRRHVKYPNLLFLNAYILQPYLLFVQVLQTVT